MELVSKYRTIINLKCISSGDTALITAARNGHSTVSNAVMLLSYCLIDCGVLDEKWS